MRKRIPDGAGAGASRLRNEQALFGQGQQPVEHIGRAGHGRGLDVRRNCHRIPIAAPGGTAGRLGGVRSSSRSPRRASAAGPGCRAVRSPGSRYAGVQAIPQGFDGHQGNASRGQLDPERQPVEQPTDLADGRRVMRTGLPVGSDGPRPIDEKCAGSIVGRSTRIDACQLRQRPDGVLLLPGNPQGRPTGHDDPDLGRPAAAHPRRPRQSRTCSKLSRTRSIDRSATWSSRPVAAGRSGPSNSPIVLAIAALT